jgi:acetate kinase
MEATINPTVLVVNCGSSSLKFAIVDPVTGDQYLTGLAEALGLPEAQISWRFGEDDKKKAALPAGANHTVALTYLEEQILEGKPELIKSFIAVGHRVVSGGELFTHPTLITDEVVKGIEQCIPLAPLHNPAHLLGIAAARRLFSALPHVAIFDTAFHQTMPPKAFMYPLPNELYTEHAIRRYGAHGTSHYYVTTEAAKLLGKPMSETNIITAHLGNGGSVSAIKNGKCVDTSMGLTPLEGIVMGTRCGDIDPSIVFFLIDTLGYTVEDVRDTLNKKSGLLGLSGKTSDFRGIIEGVEQGDEQCKLAFDIFCYRLAKYIASYYVAVGKVDALIFTGGIGENSLPMRSAVLKLLEGFGFVEDAAANAAARFGNSGQITAANSTKAFVIPTNEELVIAQGAAEFAK